MPRNDRHPTYIKQSRDSRVVRRRATVVHDGSAFDIAHSLRDYGFDVVEAPLLTSMRSGRQPGEVAILSTKGLTTHPKRLRDWTRELVGRGAAFVAIGAAIVPVAEVFGTRVISKPANPHRTARLAQVTTSGDGLFSSLPTELRLALPAGETISAGSLSTEFGATAWARDGELIGASHVFRPIHLLHSAVLDNRETRPVVLSNLLRLLRERGGRAF